MKQLDRVTGTEFYNTIKEVKALKSLYSKEEAHKLDIYDIGKRSVTVFARFFRKLHNGILPTYLIWCLLGMIAMFLILSLGK